MTKIIELKAENIKKLKAIEIKPDGNMVLLTGKNGQGKSSVLDCITYALLGKNTIPSKPIRDGEQTGTIKLDLGELIVTRKFVRKDNDEITTSVLVTNKKGAKFSSPQKMLENLLDSITFDPLSFSRMNSKEQFDEIRKIVKIDFDFEKMVRDNKLDYDERTNINREKKRLEIEIDSIDYPLGTPKDQVNTEELLEKLTNARDINNKKERVQDMVDEDEHIILGLECELEELHEGIKDIEEKIKIRKEYKIHNQAALKDLPKISASEIEEIQNKISSASEINNNVAAKIKKDALKDKLKEVYQDSKNISASIAKRNTSKETAITSAKMPIDGLSLGDGEVVFNDLPLEQASDAERLKLSCAIAMAGNQDLRVIRIKEGSLLDKDSLNLLYEMAKEKDYQVWIEKVDDSGTIGIVIEDGEIKTIN